MAILRWFTAVAFLFCVQVGSGEPVSKLPQALPGDVGLDAKKLSAIDDLVTTELRSDKMPGCVVLVGRHGKIAFLKAYGNRQVEPTQQPMTTDTVFDMASVTKPVATATSVMILVEKGKLRLDDPVAKYIPEFGVQGKDKITVRQLLTHQGGLIADNDLNDYNDGKDRAWQRIFAMKPVTSPGERFSYSDAGFIMLGALVERVSGQPLDRFSHEHIFGPLGMTETGYCPSPEQCSRTAPTESRDGHWMRGEVHDPRSYLLGGVAGHAGLFSTASDLAVFAQMLLGRGQYGSATILSPASVRRLTKPWPVPAASGSAGYRSLGWDVRTAFSKNRGQSFSPQAFGHGGFTGTGLWIDPELDLFAVFLSNRVHPNGKGEVNGLIGRINTVVGQAVNDKSLPQVNTGIDVLGRDGFASLAGRKVGLITNHTGVDRQGKTTIALLHAAKDVQVVAIFSPEHGLAGKLDVSSIADSVDPNFGIKVFSLYGKARQPTAEMLNGIDTLVYDIQDVGVRFYTYTSTLGLSMQAAAKHKLRFVVLDRPNPIGGVDVDGPVLDAGRESFVAFHRMPVRHGMTLGELAFMFQQELNLDLDLEVVRMECWRRESLFDATGLHWINPSPNIRSLNEALLYPGIGFLEYTNISVGRGTATPFELVGAPWIEGEKLQHALATENLSGVKIEAVKFTPDSSKHSGQSCGGIRIAITDRSKLQPIALGLAIARQLHLIYPKDWQVARLNDLLGNRSSFDALCAGKTVAEITDGYRPDLIEFKKQRQRYLLYP